MRAISIAMLTAASIGLLGISAASAAPANGTAIGAAAACESMIVDARLLTSRRKCVAWRTTRVHASMSKYIVRRVCVRWRHW